MSVSTVFKIYELTVSKISCTNCAHKIRNSLSPLNGSKKIKKYFIGVKNVKVNVLAEKVMISFNPELMLKKIYKYYNQKS